MTERTPNRTPSDRATSDRTPSDRTPSDRTPSDRTPSEFPLADDLLAQEDQLVFTSFTHDDAWALGSLLVELARERDLPVAIDLRRGDQQLFHHARPGTSPDNAAWIERKTNVVRRFGHSSLLVGQRHRDRGTTFEEATGLPRDAYAAHGGAFPVTVAGAGIIGTVTVSGLPQVDDHNLVVEAVRRFLGDTTH